MVWIMRTDIKYLAANICLLFFCLCAEAQKIQDSPYVHLNQTAIETFQELDHMFPLRYLRNEEQHLASYWVNYQFRSEKEARQYATKLMVIFNRLNSVSAYRKYTETVDTIGREGYGLSLTLKTDTYRQTDYLKFGFDNRKMYFYYRAGIDDMKPSREPRQDIADDMNALLRQYVKRKGVASTKVDYNDKERYRFYSFAPKPIKGYTIGVRYVIPNCTQKDFMKFHDKIQGYSMVSNVHTAFNDVYGQYEEAAIRVQQNSDRSLMVAVALKGTDLYLIRTEGDVGLLGYMPRAWAEKDPHWNINK